MDGTFLSSHLPRPRKNSMRMRFIIGRLRQRKLLRKPSILSSLCSIPGWVFHSHSSGSRLAHFLSYMPMDYSRFDHKSRS
nr:hypothetical protein Q903MT_gene3102 [Picea sitchensis]